MATNKKPKTLVQTILEQKLKAAKRRGIKLRLPRPNKPLFPDTAQRDYSRAMRKMVALLVSLTNKKVISKIGRVVEMAAKNRPNTDSRFDADDDYSEFVGDMMLDVSLDFYEEYTDDEIAAIAERIAGRVDSFNEDQFSKNFKKVLGVDPIASEPWLKQEMNAFVKGNVDLIKSVPEKYFTEVEGIIMQGARSGTLTDDLIEEVKSRYDVSDSRAELIVRDQIGKFNGNLNQLRQQNVGIGSYTWSTSGDDRVRDSHEEKDGNVYQWNDPPADTGHPGEDIQCVPEFASTSLHAPTKKAFRRWHDGELTEVVSESLETLRVTPNHPVLTLRGWVPAHLLKAGDYLIETAGQAFEPFISYPQRGNPTAKKIFSSLSKRGSFHRIAGRTSDFHGDARNKQVDIINMERKLFFDRVAGGPEFFRENYFPITPKPAFTKGHLSFDKIAFRLASDRVMGGLRQPNSSGLGSLSHSQKHRFGTPANWNLGFSQDPANRASTQAELFSDSLLAKTVQIKPDDFRLRKVKAVRRTPWSGWVHNFETLTGWYSSVNLIVHNCRCSAIPNFEPDNSEEE